MRRELNEARFKDKVSHGSLIRLYVKVTWKLSFVVGQQLLCPRFHYKVKIFYLVVTVLECT